VKLGFFLRLANDYYLFLFENFEKGNRRGGIQIEEESFEDTCRKFSNSKFLQTLTPFEE